MKLFYAVTRQAIVLAPEFAQAHSNLGNALEDQGHLDAALKAYDEAASLNPGFVEAHTNCANVLRKLGRREEATAVCERIIKQRPDSAEPYFSLGNILKELSQSGSAIQAYRRALALRPDFAEAYTNLGNVLQDEGLSTRLSKLISTLLPCARTSPKRTPIWARRSRTLAGLRRGSSLFDSRLAPSQAAPRLRLERD